MLLKNIKLIKISFILLICANSYAQQDEQSSLYMFNPMQFNPAFAGSRGDINFVAVVRSQWVGVKGAPKSQFFSLNSPLSIKNMNLGMHISNDQIGARNRTSFYGDYAYTLRFKKDRNLNFGLSGGAEQMTVDFQKLVAYDPNETDYLASFSQLNFNGGVGLYYFTKKFYAGLSVPRLFQSKLMNQSVVISNAYIKRHYFLTMGFVKPINSVIDLKSSFLLKVVENAPVTVDLNANLFFYKTFWLGAMYRYNESVGMNIAYQIKEKFMVGYSYDYPINGLSSIRNLGSHEVMLNYSINGKNKSFGSPRYF
jgi:type IX secretion system PorP/SprF family membrane protein